MKISIVVPVYNAEKYLCECVTSIQNQTLNEIQIVLVDDGSTDSSGEMCDTFQQTDRRIKVIHKSNGGLMAAWKTGVLHSEGSYIGFVDADDWIDRDMFAKLLDAAVHDNSDMVVCGLIKEYQDGRLPEKGQIRLEKKSYSKNDIASEIYPIFFSGKDYTDRGLSPNRITKLFKREILFRNLDACSDEVSIGEDLLTTFNVLKDVNRLTVLKDYHPYHYRIHDASMIHCYSSSAYGKIETLRMSLLEANENYEFDFSAQIHTDMVKLLLKQLEDEILFSGRRNQELKQRMKELYSSAAFKEAIKYGEIKKLPIKYRGYLFLMRYRFFDVLIWIRRAKCG